MTVEDPSRAVPQIESRRFGSAVSEALLAGIQGNLAYLLASVLPIGSAIDSMLTEAQFQGQTSTAWVLADGRDCTGSAYATLTGNTSVPDLRGVFVRGKNGARSTAVGNSGGDKALGTYELDQFASHLHAYTYRIPNGGSGANIGGNDDDGLDTITNNTNATGTGTETRPRSVTMNKFFRIN